MWAVRLATGLAAGLFLSLVSVGPANAQSFPDVPSSHLNRVAIEAMADRGIIGGYTNGNFGPDNLVMRQQLAKMIVLTMGFAVDQSDSHEFLDVPRVDSSLYPYHFVAVVANNGLMLGYGDGTFRPLNQTTRMQLITTVARATGSLLLKPPDDWRGVLDSSDPAHGENIRWAEYSGLLTGIAKNLAGWDTTKAATRGEVAQILYNLLVKTDYRPPLTVSNYGAKGDGTSDATQAIQRAIDARPGGGVVAIPAGAYRVSSTVSLRSNVSVEGAPGQTILTMPARSSEMFIMQGTDLSDVRVAGITFRSSGYASNVSGLVMTGSQNCAAQDLRFEGLVYGMKLGSGPYAGGWVVDGIVARDCLQPLIMAKIHDSSFSNLDLQAVKYSNQYHCLYVERDCQRLTFTDLTLTGGGGYCLHLFAAAGVSRDITFTNTVLDATNGRYGLAIGGRFSNITFNTVRIIQTDPSGPCINFHDPSNVVIDGIVAVAGLSLLGCATAPTAYPTACVIKNGTYEGPRIGTVPGVTVTNVTLLSPELAGTDSP